MHQSLKFLEMQRAFIMSIGLDMHEVISSTLIVSTKRKPRKSLFGKEIRGFSCFGRKKKTARNV